MAITGTSDQVAREWLSRHPDVQVSQQKVSENAITDISLNTMQGAVTMYFADQAGEGLEDGADEGQEEREEPLAAHQRVGVPNSASEGAYTLSGQRAEALPAEWNRSTGDAGSTGGAPPRGGGQFVGLNQSSSSGAKKSKR